MFGPFSAADFQDRYVLGGQEHPPGVSNDLLRGCKTFTVIFSEKVTTDEQAIAEAEDSVERHRASAKSGNVVDATLHYNGRIVKIFPENK